MHKRNGQKKLNFHLDEKFSKLFFQTSDGNVKNIFSKRKFLKYWVFWVFLNVYIPKKVYSNKKNFQTKCSKSYEIFFFPGYFSMSKFYKDILKMYSFLIHILISNAVKNG